MLPGCSFHAGRLAHRSVAFSFYSYATASIDDVAVWDRVWSIDEIQDLAAGFVTVLGLKVGADCVTVERSGMDVTVRWASSAVLQCATNVTGPFLDLNSASSLFTTGATNAAQFYRLRSP